jgi:hypothetical protein
MRDGLTDHRGAMLGVWKREVNDAATVAAWGYLPPSSTFAACYNRIFACVLFEAIK